MAILGPDMRETGDGKTVGLAKVVFAIIAPDAAIDRLLQPARTRAEAHQWSARRADGRH
jgi:hypothetical protein